MDLEKVPDLTYFDPLQRSFNLKYFVILVNSISGFDINDSLWKIL